MPVSLSLPLAGACGLVLALATSVVAQPVPNDSILPPVIPWNGASKSLIVGKEHPWVTHFESTGLAESPSYRDTNAWLERLVTASPVLSMESLGKSPQGRDIWLVVATTSKDRSPKALRASGKPILFAQAGIHSGEIDGKDAGLMLLRDMTVSRKKADLLDGAHFLFVPILSVDAHERASEFSRVNQRGPKVSGWRTTSRNLNLNRDYTKVDTLEMRALLGALQRWQPDLYLDLHVTDGADYQYDITYGGNGASARSSAIEAWLETSLFKAYERDLSAQGHIPGRLVFAANGRDMSEGIVEWQASPRYSNGYGDACAMPTVLVENHSLKPYGQRVLGTYVLLESSLRTIAKDVSRLRAAVSKDRGRRSREIVLSYGPSDEDPELIDFLGVRSRMEKSDVSGGEYVVWTGETIEQRIPLIRFTKPRLSVTRPKAYWIPAQWRDVIDRLALHGIEMERSSVSRTVNVEQYAFSDVELAEQPFEGRVRVTAVSEPKARAITFPAGSARIDTNQPLGVLAMLLLEPDSSDSFWQWGFFHSVIQRTEYIESYVLEPLAKRMLAEDAKLRREFEAKLESDSGFAASPRDRLTWFYRRSPYFDRQWNVYPVAREL